MQAAQAIAPSLEPGELDGAYGAAPEALVQLVASCFDAKPSRRPNFVSIADSLQQIITITTTNHQPTDNGSAPERNSMQPILI